MYVVAGEAVELETRKPSKGFVMRNCKIIEIFGNKESVAGRKLKVNMDIK